MHGLHPHECCVGSTRVGNHRNAFLHFHAIARIMIHADRSRHTLVLVAHIVGHDLVAAASRHRAALAYGAGHGIRLLAALLDLMARITAADRTGDRRQRAALAATDLVAQQAASDRTDGRTGDLVLVLHRRAVGHDFVVALALGCRGGL